MKTVCVDLDGTLAQYDGWRGEQHIGAPRPGACEFMRDLKRQYYVVILTARCRTDEDELRIRLWLAQNDVPFDEVYRGIGKPAAVAYVDDRAVCLPANPGRADFSDALVNVHRLASRQ